MPIPLRSFKSVLLALAIVLGVALVHGRGEAGPKQTAILAGGCFWCVESDFESVPGVVSAVSGFTGGTVKNPTYKQVSRGGTGHYESVKITFDSSKVSYDHLLDLFFRSVDPTDAGGQFCDRGPTYRTAIFYTNEAQKQAAIAAEQRAQQALGQHIVTKLLPAGPFYKAEAYHQDYYKGRKFVLTRFGPKRQSSAYAAYRKACGRDARVEKLWGDAAPFVGKH